MENDVAELFKQASEEKDLLQKFRHVEFLITLIKIKHGIEVPFKKGYNGNLDTARKLYAEGKYEDCIYELRKVKSDIVKEIARLQNASRKVSSSAKNIPDS
ncbi:MAG: hypothetical protein JRN26_08100 [Nitrososphaerota archaeon]|nr:hypothetical protein [Nitrososphaerota archaeon]MDG6927966.1 hypothetical protein [Nitrososphaerota archaeon]MDG6929635.1 hypothetical protein [Nitrososphaerota archaeon]MDG6932856.1 hypothetical protein [Nitrososphaerota archaeon]MDG6936821.1 hypothetical protein [Nitrososphaerota archaeon]